MGAESRDRNRRRESRRRALKILNGLYNRDRYLPFVIPKLPGVVPKKPSIIPGEHFWDIVLVPIGDFPPVLALVVAHRDEDWQTGEARIARARARSWIEQQFPDEMGRSGPGPVHVWVFGYMPARFCAITTHKGFYARALAAGELEPDPSVMCAWKFQWSTNQFPGRKKFWIGQHCQRVHIPTWAQWSREPQRHIRGYRAKGNKAWREKLWLNRERKKKGPPPKR